MPRYEVVVAMEQDAKLKLILDKGDSKVINLPEPAFGVDTSIAAASST